MEEPTANVSACVISPTSSKYIRVCSDKGEKKFCQVVGIREKPVVERLELRRHRSWKRVHDLPARIVFGRQRCGDKRQRLLHDSCALMRSNGMQRGWRETRGFSTIAEVSSKASVIDEGLQLPDRGEDLLLVALLREVTLAKVGPGTLGKFDQVLVLVHSPENANTRNARWNGWSGRTGCVIEAKQPSSFGQTFEFMLIRIREAEAGSLENCRSGSRKQDITGLRQRRYPRSISFAISSIPRTHTYSRL